MATPISASPDLDGDVRQRTKLALAVARRDLHRYTLEAMQAALTDNVPPGGHAACSRRLEFLSKRARVMAVICDRVQGTPWHVIARQQRRDVGDVQRIYEPMEAAWRQGSLTPWAAAAPDLPDCVVAGLMPLDLSVSGEADLLAYAWTHEAARPLPPPN